MAWANKLRRREHSAQQDPTTEIQTQLQSDAATELRNFQKQHRWDPFLDINKLNNVDEALNSGNAEKQAAVDESLIQEDSPYPEVRASVSSTTLRLYWVRILCAKSYYCALGSAN